MNTFGTLVVLYDVPAHDDKDKTRSNIVSQYDDEDYAVISRLAPDTVLILGYGSIEHFAQRVLSRLRRLPRETASIPIPEVHTGSICEHASVDADNLYLDELVPRLLTGQKILLITSQTHAQALFERLNGNTGAIQTAFTAPERCTEFTFDRYLTPTQHDPPRPFRTANAKRHIR